MAAINVPNASALAGQAVSGPSSSNGAGVETLESNDPGVTLDLSSYTSFLFPNYSGTGGGGSTRPSSGQVYPRGT